MFCFVVVFERKALAGKRASKIMKGPFPHEILNKPSTNTIYLVTLPVQENHFIRGERDFQDT